jgi:hypothetical protein
MPQPAGAAFPGRNGLLVVDPAGERNGLILVGADGAHPRQICTAAVRCDLAQDPVWSPDGSEIVYATSNPDDFGALVPYVISPDGSCLECPVPDQDVTFDGWDRTSAPGFLPDGRLAVWTDVGSPTVPRLGAMNTDGIGFRPFAVHGSWRQPAWSSTGRLAAVRQVGRRSEVFVIDPGTGSARQVTRNGARSPAWSPDGHRLAVVHRGSIELVAPDGGRARRLIQGGAPAWAPDGKELAFVGAHDRLFVIAARGGRPRPVGRIRATRVDWQPLPRQPPSPCEGPAGSRVASASPGATVTIDPGTTMQYTDPIDIGRNAPAFAVLGCLRADGRMRLLESLPSSDYDDAVAVGDVQVAGDYAAVVNETRVRDSLDPYFGYDTRAAVGVYDLRTGNMVADRGGEGVGFPDCTGYQPCGMDQLVLGADGVTAAHTFAVTSCESSSSCTMLEQIVASDSTGLHVLDSITTTGSADSTPSLLSELALSGDTLTWSHAGSPRSAQLN